jgi:Cd2+-exporting ATPase
MLKGTSEVNKSILTSENLSARKSTSDKLIARTLNGTEVLRGRVSRLPVKNTATNIASQIEKALTIKLKI